MQAQVTVVRALSKHDCVDSLEQEVKSRDYKLSSIGKLRNFAGTLIALGDDGRLARYFPNGNSQRVQTVTSGDRLYVQRKFGI